MNNNSDKENPKRDAFSFFWSFKDAIMGLEDKNEKLAIYEALTDYAFLGIEPTDLPPICKIIWKLIKPNIDSSIKRYDACVNNGKKGAEYGSLGGRPKNKKATKKTPEETPEETPKKTPEETPKETPKKPLNKNKDKNKDKNNKKEILSSDSIKKNAASAATLKRKEDFYHSLFPYADKYGKEMLRAFFDYWSEMNASQTKMRFEKQPTWELSKRLATWANNEKKYENNKSPATGKTKQERYAEFAEAIAAKLAAGDTGSLQDGGESALPF